MRAVQLLNAFAGVFRWSAGLLTLEFGLKAAEDGRRFEWKDKDRAVQSDSKEMSRDGGEDETG